MRVPKHQRKSYAWRWTAALAGLAVVAIALVVAVAVRPAGRVQANNFTVNVTTDADDLNPSSGNCDSDLAPGYQCSLRAAIEQANAHLGGDTIMFGSLSGTIVLGSPLPPLTDDQTTITGNGITVDGHNAAIACFEIDSASNVISGLTITHCGGVAIRITGTPATRNIVQGNTISNNGGGVMIDAGAHGNLIGGAAAQANTIANNGGGGTGATGVLVTGPNTDYNSIRRSPIFSNSGLGISILAGAGNDSVPAPVPLGITFNSTSGSPNYGQHLVYGWVNPNVYGAGSEVDVFKDDGGGQGLEYLATATVVIVAQPHTHHWEVYVHCLPVGDRVVATATDLNGNTSEFSVPSTASTVIDGNCSGTPTPTATPVPGATTTPTATPVPGATSTPTATPGSGLCPVCPAGPPWASMQSVPLAAGYNSVASTYPDNTDIAIIAGAVTVTSPGVLVSIWYYNPFAPPYWYAYSPAVGPAVNNLTSLGCLDAFSIMVTAAGTWSRPLIQ